MSEFPAPAPAPQRRYGALNVRGNVIRCDFALSTPAAPGGYVDLSHDGLYWSLVSPTKVPKVLLRIPSDQVAAVAVHPSSATTRRTPSWAVILGIIGLVFFFLGALLFLVKEDVHLPAAIVEVTTTDGRVLAVKAAAVDPYALKVGIGA